MALDDGFAPFYAEKSIPVFYDVTLVYLIFSFVAVFVGVLLILPGVRGNKRWFFLLRWSISLFIGISILVCVFGEEWQVSVVETYLPSRGVTESLAKYEIGLHIGLSSYNVTFKSLEENQSSINYNEAFHFFEKEMVVNNIFRRGLPTPILNIADFLSSNRVSNLSQWGRRYWIAGHYAIYMLWAAFAFWIVGNILLSTFIRAGGLNRVLIGLLMIGANIWFAAVVDMSSCCSIEIHLGYQNSALLKPKHGTSFWLCLAVGILSFCDGWIIFISDHFCPSFIEMLLNVEKENKLEGIETESNLELPVDRPRSFDAKPEIFVEEASTSNGFVQKESPKDHNVEAIELTQNGKVQEVPSNSSITMISDSENKSSNPSINHVE